MPMKVKKVFHKDGTYSWQVDYREPDTKRRVRATFDKKKDADALAHSVEVAKLQGRYAEVFRPEKPAFNFEALAKDYLVLCENERNFRTKRQVVNDLLLPKFSDTLLKDITYRDLELFKGEREKVVTFKGTKRSPARVNREMAVLRHMLNKAVAWGWIEVNPFFRGESLFHKEDNGRCRYLTKEEFRRLLAECADHLKPIVETAVNTGMRKNEIFQLRWEWIRGDWLYLPPEVTKTKQSRPVSLNRDQLQVFKELRAKIELTSPYVFPGLVNGKPFNTVRKAFEGACRRAGIVDFKFHDLRHTCASWLVMAGVSLRVVQKQLGHRTLAMTMRYAHLAPDHQQEAVNQIGTRDQNLSFGNLASRLG